MYIILFEKEKMKRKKKKKKMEKKKKKKKRGAGGWARRWFLWPGNLGDKYQDAQL